LPILNTIVLLASGVLMTHSHHSLINKNKKSALMSLYFTIGSIEGMDFLKGIKIAANIGLVGNSLRLINICLLSDRLAFQVLF